MNAVPLIASANSGGTSDANAASGKTSALPEFAQVLAAKQAPASAGQSDRAAAGSATPAQADTRAAGQINGPATNTPANGAANGNMRTPATAKKGDGKVAGLKNFSPTQVATNAALLLNAINVFSPVPLQAEPETAQAKSPDAQGGSAQLCQAIPEGALSTTAVSSLLLNVAPSIGAAPEAARIVSTDLAAGAGMPESLTETSGAAPTGVGADATLPSSIEENPAQATTPVQGAPAEQEKNATVTGGVQAVQMTPDTSAEIGKTDANPGSEDAAPNSTNAEANSPNVENADPSTANDAGDSKIGGESPKAQSARPVKPLGLSETFRKISLGTGNAAEATAEGAASPVIERTAEGKTKDAGNSTAQASASIAPASVKADAHTIEKPQPAGAAAPESPPPNYREKTRGSTGEGHEDAETANSDANGAADAGGKNSGFGLEGNPTRDAAQAGQHSADPGVTGAESGLSAMIAAPAKQMSTVNVSTVDAGKSGTAPSMDGDDARPQTIESKVLNVSQFAGNDAHSEVRIAMQAEQLGQVELRASVSGQQVGAAITVEKKEAHAAMVAELPTLQQALEERHLRVSEVVLTHSILHATSGEAGNQEKAPAEHRETPARTPYPQAETEARYGSDTGAIWESSGIFDDRGRLSVRV